MPAGTDEEPSQQKRPGRWGRPTGKDVVSGLVTGLFSIPESMAYASIGNFAAPLGLWSGVVPTIVGSMLTRTVLMVTTLTSALALSSQDVLLSAGLATDDLGAVATLTVMVGLIMLLMGLLKLGSVVSYVSTAVMTGFTTGISVQILAGVIKDATGYVPASDNTVGKIVEALWHVGDWKSAAVLVSVSTLACWAAVWSIRRLRHYATLAALVVASVVAAVVGAHVERVRDIAEIPRQLPPISIPDLSAFPVLILGALAVALVGLTQAAGISAAVPNPDRSRPDISRDFAAQGMANIAGGLFSGLPTGGSLSRTGVAIGAGARTRWAGIFAGLWLGAIVLAVGPLAGYIPMPVIGGLMLVVGAELIAARRHDIVLVVRTSGLSTVAMVVTFVATTALPLQVAIFIGAALSIVLTAVRVTRASHLLHLVRMGDHAWRPEDPPRDLPSDRTTVLHYASAGFFSEVPRLQEEWPDTSRATNAAIVLSMRGSAGVPSATFLKALGRFAAGLRERGIPLVISGVPQRFVTVIERTHRFHGLSQIDLVPEAEILGDGMEIAYRRAEALRTGEADDGEGPGCTQADDGEVRTPSDPAVGDGSPSRPGHEDGRPAGHEGDTSH